MITGDSYIGSNRQHRLCDQVSANTRNPLRSLVLQAHPGAPTACAGDSSVGPGDARRHGRVPSGIGSSAIAKLQVPVEYYADVEWTDNAPAMVQLLLIQSFQNTGRLPVEFTKISGGEPIRTAPHTRAGRPRSAPDAGAVYRSPFTSSGRGSR